MVSESKLVNKTFPFFSLREILNIPLEESLSVMDSKWLHELKECLRDIAHWSPWKKRILLLLLLTGQPKSTTSLTTNLLACFHSLFQDRCPVPNRYFFGRLIQSSVVVFLGDADLKYNRHALYKSSARLKNHWLSCRYSNWEGKRRTQVYQISGWDGGLKEDKNVGSPQNEP